MGLGFRVQGLGTMSALVSGAWRVWKRKRESIMILYGTYAIVAESVVEFSLVEFSLAV